MTEITDKTFVIVTRLGDFWVNQDRATRVMSAKKNDPQGFVEFEGNLVSCSSIDGILDAKAYDLYNKKKNGHWQCNYKYWHKRFEQCAHHLIDRRT